MYPTNNQAELTARNARALTIIINNFAEDGVPADVLEAFRVEAMESGYDLTTERGADWYSNRSLLAEWFKEQRAAAEKARIVEFYWDYEDCGSEGMIQSCYVEGLEIDGLHEYLQDCGLTAARKLVKKACKAAGKIFKEVTDAGMAQDYARDRMINWNLYQRA